MSEDRKEYDSTVARIAGNILSSVFSRAQLNTIGWRAEHLDEKAVLGAVRVARAIVAATKETQPAQELADAAEVRR